jgi:hypothetical protein
MSAKSEFLSARAASIIAIGCLAVTASVIFIMKRNENAKLDDVTDDDDTITVLSESDSPIKGKKSKSERPKQVLNDEDLENDLNLIGEVSPQKDGLLSF